jgi:hypothetical protein
MRQIHRDYPPRRKEWSVYQPITRPMLDWFMGVAPRLEILTVVVEEKNVPGLLPELLAQAAKRAPQLRELHVAGDWESGAVHKSLSSLSQITELCLESWEFPACGNVKEMQRLSGLKSLEVDFFILGFAPDLNAQIRYLGPGLRVSRKLNPNTTFSAGSEPQGPNTISKTPMVILTILPKFVPRSVAQLIVWAFRSFWLPM